MKKLWARFCRWLTWRRIAWWATVALVVAMTVAAGAVTRATWRRWPPTDAVSAWTVIAGVGALFTAVGTMALAAFAYRGLRSITIARDEILHRTKREAQICAIERMAEIPADVMRLAADALDAMAKHGVPTFLGPEDDVQFEPDPKDISAARRWNDALPQNAREAIVMVLNRLEAWSVYFSTGVADESVAFGPIAPLLRSWVGQYYAVLLTQRSRSRTPTGKNGPYPNLIRLYNLWSAKMNADQLSAQHADIQQQMESAKKRVAAQQPLPPTTPNLLE